MFGVWLSCVKYEVFWIDSKVLSSKAGWGCFFKAQWRDWKVIKMNIKILKNELVGNIFSVSQTLKKVNFPLHHCQWTAKMFNTTLTISLSIILSWKSLSTVQLGKHYTLKPTWWEFVQQRQVLRNFQVSHSLVIQADYMEIGRAYLFSSFRFHEVSFLMFSLPIVC